MLRVITGWRIGAVGLGMAMLMAVLCAAPARAEAGRPAVLFVHVDPTQVRTWDDWLASGFEIDARPIGAIKSAADLKPFNVVVIQDLPPVDGEGKVHKDQPVFEKALDEFLRAGGGVLAFCTGSGFANTTLALSHLLKPYGAFIPEEQVTDPRHLFGPIGEYPNGCFTTRIEDAPMTRGVKRLGYMGDASRADCIETTMPVVLQEPAGWQVVVRGEESAYSAEGKNPGSTAALKETPATYAHSPVLAAWRNVGAGRLFVTPHNACVTTASPEVFLNILWNRRDQEEPDALQNRTFLLQTARWAAEPSLAAGTFGGFVTDRKFRPDERAILKGPEAPIEWSKVGTGENLSPALGSVRGLVGAQSAISGGRHTVADLCAAARAAGLHFLAFTENLEHLTAESWERLKAECAAQSSDDFLALPGMLALDKAGNTWFALGWATFPAPPALTPDLKRIDNTYMVFARSFGTRFVGYARVARNPNPWFEMKHASAMAVLTHEPGRPVEDVTDSYLRSCADQENTLPFAVTLLDTPAGIAEAARGTLNIFTGPSVNALRDCARAEGAYTSSLYWADPPPWYLSRGPRLLRHGGYNLGNFAIAEERENLFRYGFRLAGLRAGDRVLLYDGTRLIREWRAAGDTFAVERTWPHEQVRQFLVRVVRGEETVLLSAPVTLHYGPRFMQCSDRQNTLPFNYQPDRDGSVYVSGIPLGAHYRTWTPHTLVYGNFKIWLTGANHIEYQPPMYMTFWTSPEIPFDHERKEGSRSLSSVQHHVLSCPGMLIVDEFTDRVYPDGGAHEGDCRPPKLTEPLQLFNLRQRRYALYGALDQLNGQLVDSRITALQDVALRGNSVLVSVLTHPMKENAPQVAEVSVGGKVERYPFKDAPAVSRTDAMAPGDYAGIYPHGLAGGGAQYAVAGKLTSSVATPGKSAMRAVVYLDVPTQWKKGDTFDYRMLFTTGGSVPHRPASEYEKTVAFLGLRDGTFPAITRVEGGTLLKEPAVATLQAVPEAVLRLETKHNPEDPLGLPIRVRGFEPNWQLVYTLNGSKTWRYCGRVEGDAYFHLYTNRSAYTVALGHPVLADRPEARIALDDADGKQRAFEVYNSTGQPLVVTLRANPAFLPAQTRKVTLAPYESRLVAFE